MIVATRANRQLMRELNTKLVLGSVRETEGISQIEISERTGLSVGTVFSIVKHLKDEGLVEEIGPGESTIGRKPMRLRLNPKYRYVIAGLFLIDETRVALLDLSGKICGRIAYPTRSAQGPASMIKEFCNHARTLLRQHRVPSSRLQGIGVCTGGVVDHLSGTVVYSPGIEWYNQPVQALIEREMGAPTIVDGYGVAAIVAEWQWGASRGITNLCALEQDYAGVGLTTVAHGAIVRGEHRMAGEIGGFLIAPRQGESKPQQLHKLAAGWAMVERAREAIRSGGKKSTIDASIDSTILHESVSAIFAAAANGDEVAIKVIDDAAYALGIAAANIITVLNPEAIILTGRVIDDARGMMTERVRAVALEALEMPQFRSTRIEVISMGEDAPLIGAATFVLDTLFQTRVTGRKPDSIPRT